MRIPVPETLFPVSQRGTGIEIRELDEDDLEPIAECAADPEVMRYVMFGRTFLTTKSVSGSRR